MHDVIRIAHVSDLHLGVERATAVWRSLRDHLAKEIKPDLVAVTGDVVNTPDRTAFESAKAELDALGIPYRLCPGNHDRHPLGNAPSFLGKLVDALSPTSSAHAWFDQVFGAAVARPEDSSVFELARGENRWRVRIAGFDTSVQAKHSAQGFAELASLDQLKGTLERTADCDLMVVLLHHHLLPIAELEAARQALRNLLAPTVMLNAGTMLERLARGNVNLVLHGHEHHRAVARYGTLGGSGHDVMILAAGSATGTKTGEGADQARASINLIELQDDRTVLLREIKFGLDGWRIDDRAPIALFDHSQIDRARFHRRVRARSSPISRLVKCVEFHANRDISLTETRTDWVVERGSWRLTTVNSSGLLSPARVVFDWSARGRSEFELERRLDQSADHSYCYELQLEEQHDALARRMVVAFQWSGGGILTEEDFALLDPGKRGPFRNEGLEYAGVRVENELERLSLLVRLPPEFAPAADGLEVSIFAHGAGAAERQKDPLLARALQHHAPGMFSLEVPYPQKAHTYAIAWRPRRAAEAGRTITALRDGGSPTALLGAFRDALIRRQSRLSEATVALYLPAKARSVTLLRVADHVPQGCGERRAPAQISLREAAHTLYRQVWWGSPKVALRERDHDETFVADEQALAVLPIVSPLSRPGEVAEGLVRIGLCTAGGSPADDAVELLSIDVLYEGMLSLLQSAAQRA